MALVDNGNIFDRQLCAYANKLYYVDNRNILSSHGLNTASWPYDGLYTWYNGIICCKYSAMK